MLTIEYRVNGRDYQHSGRGEALTRVLRFLNSQGLQWKYANPASGSNLFANLAVSNRGTVIDLRK